MFTPFRDKAEGLKPGLAATIERDLADIAAVEVSVSLVDLLRAFEDSGHSRMPVYRETLDDAIGMVHIKDLVGHITGHGPSASPDDLAREYGYAARDN